MTQTTEAPKPQRSRGHLCPVYITLARPMRRSKGEKSPADPLAPITAPAMLRSCNCHRPATGAATALEPGSGAHHAALPCRRSPLPVPGTAPLKPVPALALLCRRCCEVAAVKSSLLCRRHLVPGTAVVAGVAPPTASHADTAAAFATVAATLQPAPRAWAQRWLRGAPSSRSTCSAPSPRKLLSTGFEHLRV